MEKYNIAISTTTSNPSAFTPLTATPEIAPEVWTKMSYDLSAWSGQDVYIGIQCVSDTAFIFMIDDISITSTAGTGDRLSAEQINVYPNPVRDKFTVRFVQPGSSNVELDLISSYGICVRSQTLPAEVLQTSFGVTGLAPGLYTLRIQKEGTTRYHKISVIN